MPSALVSCSSVLVGLLVSVGVVFWRWRFYFCLRVNRLHRFGRLRSCLPELVCFLQRCPDHWLTIERTHRF